MRSVFIAHGASAYYPEIQAYTEFLTAHGLAVSDGPIERWDQEGQPDILWCLMGFFPRLSTGRSVVIHDYRSLSVGRLPWLKDALKRRAQRAPNLRIFQNEIMRAMMRFDDDVPSVLLPMGVPSHLVSGDGPIAAPVAQEANTFAYVGAMTLERRFDRFVSAFVESDYARSHRLVLIGEPEESIRQKFAGKKGIVFTGRLPHAAALARVRQAAFAVSYFPFHRPHSFQTPTKLIEYAAVGSKIVCNNSPSNLRTIAEFGLPCVVSGPMVFDGLDLRDLQSLKPAHPESVRTASWDDVLLNSRVLKELERVTGR